jgi:ketosteroid isomerase-like protein
MTVEQTLEKYIEATNTHDFRNVAKYVAQDAVYWFTNKECQTLPEIEAYFNNTWEKIKNEKYQISNVNWIAIEANLASCLYTYHWEGYYDGNLVSGSGNATNVFRKIDGEWKLIHEHLSPLK